MFSKLPTELSLEILSHLNPEQIIASSTVSKLYYSYTNDNLLWKNRMRRHFPETFTALKHKEELYATDESFSINWKKEFETTYLYEYQKLTKIERLLFSLVKEGDLQQVKQKINKSKRNLLDLLSLVDIYGQTLLDHACEYPSLLNYFYRLIEQEYTIDNEISVLENKDNKTILYWAIVTGQDVETIKLLIEKDKSVAWEGLLHAACLKNRLDVVNLLLSYKQGRESINTYVKNKNSLQAACSNKRSSKELIKTLLEKGAHIDYHLDSLCYEHNALHYACLSGNLDALRLILSHPKGKQLINKTNLYNYTPFQLACSKGHIEIVRFLLEETSTLVDQIEIDSFLTKNLFNKKLTAFHLACDNDSISVVHYLLEKISLLDKEQAELMLNNTSYGMTPLHSACSKGYLSIVKLLLNNSYAKKSLFKQNIQKLTPLHFACYNGYEDVVRFLLNEIYSSSAIETTKELLTQANFDKMTLLHLACISGNVNIVEQLLNVLSFYNNQDQNTKLIHQFDSNGLAPIHLACKYGRLNIVKFLLDNQSEQNLLTQLDAQGRSPFHVACYYGQLDIVRFFLINKKSLDLLEQTDNKGMNPLHLACLCFYEEDFRVSLTHGLIYPNNARNLEVLQFLLTYDQVSLQIDKTTNVGKTALELACNFNDTNFIKVLCNKKANINFINPLTGNTILHSYLLKDGAKSKIISSLIRLGADITQVNSDGLTPFQQACKLCLLTLAKATYIKDKVNVNTPALNGNTPLMLACSYKFDGKLNAKKIFLVKYLVSIGAKLDSKNAQGQTALDLFLQLPPKQSKMVYNYLLEAINKSGLPLESCASKESIALIEKEKEKLEKRSRPKKRTKLNHNGQPVNAAPLLAQPIPTSSILYPPRPASHSMQLAIPAPHQYQAQQPTYLVPSQQALPSVNNPTELSWQQRIIYLHNLRAMMAANLAATPSILQPTITLPLSTIQRISNPAEAFDDTQPVTFATPKPTDQQEINRIYAPSAPDRRSPAIHYQAQPAKTIAPSLIFKDCPTIPSDLPSASSENMVTQPSLTMPINEGQQTSYTVSQASSDVTNTTMSRERVIGRFNSLLSIISSSSSARNSPSAESVSAPALETASATPVVTQQPSQAASQQIQSADTNSTATPGMKRKEPASLSGRPTTTLFFVKKQRTAAPTNDNETNKPS